MNKQNWILLSLLSVIILVIAISALPPQPAKAYVFGGWVSGAIGSDNVTTAEINLGQDYDRANIDIPTENSTTLTFLVSRSTGGTYKQLGASAVSISAGTGNSFTTIDLGGFQYLKIVSSSQQTQGLTYWVRGYTY